MDQMKKLLVAACAVAAVLIGAQSAQAYNLTADEARFINVSSTKDTFDFRTVAAGFPLHDQYYEEQRFDRVNTDTVNIWSYRRWTGGFEPDMYFQAQITQLANGDFAATQYSMCDKDGFYECSTFARAFNWPG